MLVVTGKFEKDGEFSDPHPVAADSKAMTQEGDDIAVEDLPKKSVDYAKLFDDDDSTEDEQERMPRAVTTRDRELPEAKNVWANPKHLDANHSYNAGRKLEFSSELPDISEKDAMKKNGYVRSWLRVLQATEKVLATATKKTERNPSKQSSRQFSDVAAIAKIKQWLGDSKYRSAQAIGIDLWNQGLIEGFLDDKQIFHVYRMTDSGRDFIRYWDGYLTSNRDGHKRVGKKAIGVKKGKGKEKERETSVTAVIAPSNAPDSNAVVRPAVASSLGQIHPSRLALLQKSAPMPSDSSNHEDAPATVATTTPWTLKYGPEATVAPHSSTGNPAPANPPASSLGQIHPSRLALLQKSAPMPSDSSNHEDAPASVATTTPWTLKYGPEATVAPHSSTGNPVPANPPASSLGQIHPSRLALLQKSAPMPSDSSNHEDAPASVATTTPWTLKYEPEANASSRRGGGKPTRPLPKTEDHPSSAMEFNSQGRKGKKRVRERERERTDVPASATGANNIPLGKKPLFSQPTMPTVSEPQQPQQPQQQQQQVFIPSYESSQPQPQPQPWSESLAAFDPSLPAALPSVAEPEETYTLPEVKIERLLDPRAPKRFPTRADRLLLLSGTPIPETETYALPSLPATVQTTVPQPSLAYQLPLPEEGTYSRPMHENEHHNLSVSAVSSTASVEYDPAMAGSRRDWWV
jgi:hypothetical protein